MTAPPLWLQRLQTTPLRTRRLVIRPPQLEDAPSIRAAVRESLAQLAPWLIWARRGYDLAAARQFVRAAARNFHRGTDFGLIMTTHTGEFVGGTGFHCRGPSNARYFEIGYWCRTSFAGRGYTTEAAKALIRYAFRAPDVRRIEIRCDPRNGASERVIRKCGLVKEGHLRKVARDLEGKLRDQLVFARVR